MQANAISTATVIVTPEQLLAHWQGHRGLTRRVIEAFPEDKLFNYSIGGMRPFSDVAMELITLTFIGIYGTATGEWKELKDLYAGDTQPKTKEGILKLWDAATIYLNEYWRQIEADRWQEVDAALGQYEQPVYSSTLYWLDNENHHRGQGYVYLRSLGIEPPFFWDRG
jgi:uncharacterized damage-inducible protein DinB